MVRLDNTGIGSILWQTLFNMYGEYIITTSLEVGGRQLKNLRFTDNVALCTRSETDMKELLE